MSPKPVSRDARVDSARRRCLLFSYYAVATTGRCLELRQNEEEGQRRRVTSCPTLSCKAPWAPHSCPFNGHRQGGLFDVPAGHRAGISPATWRRACTCRKACRDLTSDCQRLERGPAWSGIGRVGSWSGGVDVTRSLMCFPQPHPLGQQIANVNSPFVAAYR